MLNDLYFKTTCNIRPHFLGPIGGPKIEGLLYMCYSGHCNFVKVNATDSANKIWSYIEGGLKVEVHLYTESIRLASQKSSLKMERIVK